VIYLTQVSSSPAVMDLVRSHPKIGLLLTPREGRTGVEGVTWGADNSAFTGQYPGDEKFLRWLDRKLYLREWCRFVTAPDVVGNFEATWELSEPMLRQLRSLGWPAALVAQDGMEESDWDCWSEIDALFIGGTTSWKLGPALELVRQAQSHGKWVHVGAINSRRRYWWADHHGIDSGDGTMMKRGPDKNLPRLVSWLDPVLEGM